MPRLLRMLSMLAWLSHTGLSLAQNNFNTTTTTSPSPSSSPSSTFRILPLGASVTFGTGSSTGNSYRKDLIDLLVKNRSEVQYVGRKTNGDFEGDRVEATPGFIIRQIVEAASVAVPLFQPNLVLIDAGTNNCNAGGIVPDAGANVTAMVNKIFGDSPGVTIVLATILRNPDEKMDACRVDINSQYTILATDLQAKGAKIILADMRSPQGPLTTDLADGRHPNDGGYVKMADVWFAAVEEAVRKGFIVKPVVVEGEGEGKGGSSTTSTPTAMGLDGGPSTSTTSSMSPSGSGSAANAAKGKSTGVRSFGEVGCAIRWSLGVLAVYSLL